MFLNTTCQPMTTKAGTPFYVAPQVGLRGWKWHTSPSPSFCEGSRREVRPGGWSMELWRHHVRLACVDSDLAELRHPALLSLWLLCAVWGTSFFVGILHFGVTLTRKFSRRPGTFEIPDKVGGLWNMRCYRFGMTIHFRNLTPKSKHPSAIICQSFQHPLRFRRAPLVSTQQIGKM